MKDEITVTVHVSPDCRPETLQALAEMVQCLIEQIDDGRVKIGRDLRPRCTCYSYPKVQSAGCVVHNPPVA
jgi:hypothetical protein